jgi:hypothetical protein
VQFEVADAYALDRVEGESQLAWQLSGGRTCSASVRQRFLSGLHRRLGVGAVIVLTDNRFVEGSSTAISRRDAAGNTYQQRRLADGTTHEVLKNFPTGTEVRTVFSPLADELSIAEFAYYWIVRYRVASAA